MMEAKVVIDLQTVKFDFAPLNISGRMELIGKGHTGCRSHTPLSGYLDLKPGAIVTAFLQ